MPVPYLGTSELAVSRFAIGAWQTFERMERDAAAAVVRHAFDRGITFFDVARYDDRTGSAPLASGWSEVVFGEVVRAAGLGPEDVVVAEKLWWERWPEENAAAELEASLERLGFGSVGLIYADPPPPDLPAATVVDEVAGLLAEGRARAWGVVNWPADRLAGAVRAAAAAGVPPPCAVQLPYSLARRDWVEDPAMEEALAAAGASLVPSAVLDGGALTGKYAGGGAGGRLAGSLDAERTARALALVPALADLAAELEATPATLALAFALAHPRTGSLLFGATSPAQVDANLAAAGVLGRLAADDLERLRAIGAG